jgi:hypothetical protein
MQVPPELLDDAHRFQAWADTQNPDWTFTCDGTDRYRLDHGPDGYELNPLEDHQP